MEQKEAVRTVGVWTKPRNSPPGLPLIMACAEPLPLGPMQVTLEDTGEVQGLMVVRTATFQEYKASNPDLGAPALAIIAMTASHFYVVATD